MGIFRKQLSPTATLLIALVVLAALGGGFYYWWNYMGKEQGKSLPEVMKYYNKPEYQQKPAQSNQKPAQSNQKPAQANKPAATGTFGMTRPPYAVSTSQEKQPDKDKQPDEPGHQPEKK